MRNKVYKLNLDSIDSIEDVKDIFSVLDFSFETQGEDIMQQRISKVNDRKELFTLKESNNDNL